MHPTAILISGLAILQLASAKVTGFAVPSHIAVDSDIKIEILTEFEPGQNIQDVAMTFGIADGNAGNPEGKGKLLSEKFLGMDLSNANENITHFVHIPATWPLGMGDIASILFELVGSEQIPMPIFRNFKAPVMVGNYTSQDYIMSTEFTPPAANNTMRVRR